MCSAPSHYYTTYIHDTLLCTADYIVEDAYNTYASRMPLEMLSALTGEDNNAQCVVYCYRLAEKSFERNVRLCTLVVVVLSLRTDYACEVCM